MTQDLLAELHRAGIKLRLVEGRLDVLAPAGTLTADLRERLRANRDTLLATLSNLTTSQPEPALVPHPDQRHQPFPLTDIQHAYWVGRRTAIELGGVSTHLYTERERTGLDVPRLQHSLRQVITRHDMLRAVIRPDGTQHVLPHVPPYTITTQDLRHLTDQQRDTQLTRTRAEMDHQVLPADRWPLFDIRASLLDGDRLRLHISLDILIMDGFSMNVLFHDWRHYYQNPHWQPEPLELSYRDHVLAEQHATNSERAQRAETYWHQRLHDLPPAPALPLAVQPSQLGRPQFTHRHGRLPQTHWQAIKTHARTHALTPSAVLLTAYAHVLRLWSQQPSLTVNLTLLNRPPTHPQINQLIGDFTSVTLLALQGPWHTPFTQQVQHTQTQLLQDLEHTQYNGIRVMRERARREGAGPGATMPIVFTSMITTNDDQDPTTDMDFFGELRHQISQTPQVWLDHQVTEEHGDLVYNWDAVEALFAPHVLDDMFTTFTTLLHTLATNPHAWQTPLQPDLPTWQTTERDHANNTTTDLPEHTLNDLIETQARQTPHAPAIIHDNHTTTYQQLTHNAHRLSRRLLQLGAEPGTLIAIVIDKSPHQATAVLGITGTTAAYLPIDPHWPQARRDQLITLAKTRLIVTTPHLRDTLTWPDHCQLITPDDPEVQNADPSPLPQHPTPTDLAYVIYTSGSTGQPKGVMINHRGAANTIQDINQRFTITPNDRILALSALSFDLSVYDLFGPLAAGATTIIPTTTHTHDPHHWTTLAHQHHITIWNTVPALMQAWLDTPTNTGTKTGTTPQTQTETRTGNETRNKTGTGTQTGTGTTASTETETGTGTGDQPEAGTGTGVGAGDQAGAGTTAGAVVGAGAGAGDQAGTGTGTGVRAGDQAGAGTTAGAVVEAGAGAGAGDQAGTGTTAGAVVEAGAGAGGQAGVGAGDQAGAGTGTGTGVRAGIGAEDRAGTGVAVGDEAGTGARAAVGDEAGTGEAGAGGSALRLVLLSGDWIPVTLPDAIRAAHPNAQVVSLGGATEASIWSVAYPIGHVPPHWTRIPYGKPLANQTLHVLDEHLRPCPVWTAGEIHIGGTGLALGYWAAPQLTEERFITHPDTKQRLYRTGDLGRYLPGGDIEFLGRADFQVKLNGYRIEPGEIEAVLRNLPGIHDAIATIATNPLTNRRHLVAHIITTPTTNTNTTGNGTGIDGWGDGVDDGSEAERATALRTSLEQLLPAYLVPQHYVFIDHLPLSPNGKVDRTALPTPWPDPTTQQTAPRDDLERQLLTMWAGALGHHDFGIHDNFFEIGGDSLHAVRILAQIREQLGIEQEAEEDLELLFDRPTIAELAEELTNRTRN